MKKNLIVFAAALVALLVGVYLGWQRFTPEHETGDATLAQIELPDIEKKLRRGDEWLGKVVVVNHWATWCPPCREEIPLLIESQQRFGEQGMQVIGIAHDLLDTARAFGDTIGINYPSLIAITGGNKLMRQQGNPSGALPFTVFFNRNGNQVDAKLGQLTAAELRRIVLPLL